MKDPALLDFPSMVGQEIVLAGIKGKIEWYSHFGHGSQLAILSTNDSRNIFVSFQMSEGKKTSHKK